MGFKLRHSILKRDSIDESFEVVGSENHFENEEYIIGIDSDTLIGVELIITTILNNDFKNWNMIKENDEINSFSSLLLKLGYKKEEIEYILNEM
ncbi:MAG: hypothetical protein LBR15_10545 [Methanobrevibacter sp.]|jgi:hypothetical protein|nr:hypothetical protein [Candidatus Methanovirga australis]